MGVFLFWNLGKQDLKSEVSALCDELEVDVLILAECSIPSSDVVAALNKGSLGGYAHLYDPAPKSKFKWFTRFPITRLQRVLDGGGLSLVTVELLGGLKVLIGAVHLVSKVNADDDEQFYEASIAAEVIRSTEVKIGIDSTLIIGDFNMNPFDKGMAAVSGFNAVMDRAIAKRVKVTYKKKESYIFYNPMWNYLGDDSVGPPGTHYYSRRLIRYYWNMYDQVLLRPALLDFVRDGDIKIVGESMGAPLAGSGKKWLCKSDHLPVYARIRG